MKRERLNPGGDVNEQERGNQIRAAWGGVAPDMSVPHGQGSTLLRAPAATLKDGTEEEESAVGCLSCCRLLSFVPHKRQPATENDLAQDVSSATVRKPQGYGLAICVPMIVNVEP